MPIRPTSSLLTWLLGLALLLSLGLNLYWLSPQLDPRPYALAREDEDDEEGDTSWTTLQEELRQARQQLAECQGRPGTAAAVVPATEPAPHSLRP